MYPFLDEKGSRRIADNKGNLISFDGIHLSGSGVRMLGDSFKGNVIFLEKIRSLRK